MGAPCCRNQFQMLLQHSFPKSLPLMPVWPQVWLFASVFHGWLAINRMDYGFRLWPWHRSRGHITFLTIASSSSFLQHRLINGLQDMNRKLRKSDQSFSLPYALANGEMPFGNQCYLVFYPEQDSTLKCEPSLSQMLRVRPWRSLNIGFDIHCYGHLHLQPF